MQKIWVQSLGWEEPLEEEMATHCSILGWRIPMYRGAWQATVHRVAKSGTLVSDTAHCFLTVFTLLLQSFISHIFQLLSHDSL